MPTSSASSGLLYFLLLTPVTYSISSGPNIVRKLKVFWSR
jgi:hypothetical protein